MFEFDKWVLGKIVRVIDTLLLILHFHMYNSINRTILYLKTSLNIELIIDEGISVSN